MARRTKEDALATRDSLLDAAELLFLERGVSRTSLHDIAQAAGVTRGAVYWHFKDKADLFNAMMERVTLPLEQALRVRSDAVAPAHPLLELRAGILNAFRQTATHAQTRRVFEVATQKVEYVDEMSAIRTRHQAARADCVAQMQSALRSAAAHQRVRLKNGAASAAQGLHALVDGLIQNWLLDPDAFALEATGTQAVDCFLAGLGLSLAGSKRKVAVVGSQS